MNPKISDFGMARLFDSDDPDTRHNNKQNHGNLAWISWRANRPLDIVDSAITKNDSRNEMMKCINIGLLCVQDSVMRRPNMKSVLHWLNSHHSMTLPVPSKPAFVVNGDSGEASRVSITELLPR